MGLVLCTGLTANCEAADKIEFVDGKSLEGKVVEIRKAKREVAFESVIGTQTLKRFYAYGKIHAVTMGGKRFVITPMSSSKGDAGKSEASTSEAGIPERSKAEVIALIQEVGGSPPSWLESTPLDYPDSLETDWPLKAEGKWNESKNVGQYLWGRVYPNTRRWKSGLKLIHQIASEHQNKPQLLKRDWETLGKIYFTLFQDYPRAAYWLQKAKVKANQSTGVHLAECYWRLGNRPMARSLLRGNSLHFDAIKLLGDMGELKQALALTKRYSKTNQFNEAFLNMGDALRREGRYDQAIEYYQQVISRNRARNKEYLARYKARASGAIEAIRLFEQSDVSRVADGTYRDRSTGYNGKLEVEVVVSDSMIDSVKVTSHKEKQFYAALTDTTKQIVDKQGVQGIDGTSGATITSQAIIHATARALAQGFDQ